MKNNLKYIAFSILSFLSFYKYLSLYIKNNYLIYLLYIVLFILLFLYYKKLYKDIKLDNKYKIFIIIMSFIITLGYSYEVTSTPRLFFGSFKYFILSMLKLMGFYYFFKTCINYLLIFMKKEVKGNSKLINKFKSHPYLYSFIFLTICYGLFLIVYYPGIINYDNANQIKEVMGMHTRYLDAINPISSSTLTNFNPIIHTILLGGLFKLGYIIGSVNFGLFLYTILQMFIVISIYSYVIYYCIKNNANIFITFGILIILGLIPTFAYYSITAVKDTLYTVFLLLYSLKLYDLTHKEELSKKDYLKLFITSMLVCLFRNNGIFIVFITIPFLFYKNRKFIITFILILLSYFSFNNILLPNLGVSSTSVREALSVPFQQTARLVKYKEESISIEDRLIIKKILDYDNLKKDYNEDLADPVKNKFNKDYESEDLKNYFLVWFKYLFKYPGIYIDATINNITSYFNPFENSWKVYHKLNRKLPEAGFAYHFNKLDKARNMLHNYEIFIEASPIGLILNIALLTWFSILVFLMLLKNKNYIFLLPNIISILFCVLSPANTYYRYIYPTLVLMVTLFPLIKKEYEIKKKK